MNQSMQPKACEECPFSESGRGRLQRESLAFGRFERSNGTVPDALQVIERMSAV